MLLVPEIDSGSDSLGPTDHGDTDQLLNPPTKSVNKKSVVPFLLQWTVVLLLLGVWFLVTFLLPVPGCPKGYLGAGGLGDYGRYPSCTGGAAGYLDTLIFGNHHIFQRPTCKEIYQTGAYDPEGALGSLTSIVLCFLGVQAGRIIETHHSALDRLKRWAIWGVLLLALGTLLCQARQNGGWIPINKNLWSPSFIFVMGGTGFLVLSILYILVDVKRFWNGAPFIYVGMNPILIYCGHEILADYFPFQFTTIHSYRSHALVLASNLLGVSVWMFVAYMFYLNRFFVNI